MHCDDLVTENIVSWSNVGWDLDGPGVVVLDQIVGSPVSWGSRAIDETSTADLEELKVGNVG